MIKLNKNNLSTNDKEYYVELMKMPYFRNMFYRDKESQELRNSLIKKIQNKSNASDLFADISIKGQRMY